MYSIIILCVCFFYVSVSSSFSQGFVEISEEAGINHLFDVGDVIFGGGVAVFDFDNDGWEDFYVTGGISSDALYRNNKNGTFTNVFEGSGLELTNDYLTQGVVTGDIDKDGDKDIFISVRAPVDDWTKYAHNLLFRNNSDGTFTDITAEWKLDNEINFSTSASFGDVNLDGQLDLFVGNYISDVFQDVFFLNGQNSILMNGDNDYLYINRDASFENVSSSYQITIKGCAFGTAFTDYDWDGDMDIYIANDFGNTGQPPNIMYNNLYPENKYMESGNLNGSDIAMNAMGIAIGDYNNDTHLDYFVTNMGPDYLLKNNGDGTFTEASVEAEVVKISVPYQNRFYLAVSWGAIFFDYNHDGYQDLFVSNGDLSPPALPNSNVLFKNDGDGSFTDITSEIGLGDPHLGRGAATFDFDLDGDLDLLVVNQKYPENTGIEDEVPNFCLYENRISKDGDWLKIKLKGINANIDGYGARVVIHRDGRRYVREVDGGSSHMSQNSSILHFGLAKGEEIDLIEVYWPGGKRQILENVFPNQQITITENDYDTPVISSISTHDLNDNVKIYPNPAKDRLQISFIKGKMGDFSYVISDILGKELLRGYGEINEKDHLRTSIDLTNLTSGLYLINIYGKVEYEKIFMIKK